MGNRMHSENPVRIAMSALQNRSKVRFFNDHEIPCFKLEDLTDLRVNKQYRTLAS